MPAVNSDSIPDLLQFEMMLTELSARFVSTSPDQVDREISDAQSSVCKCLGLDFCVVWQWTGDAPDILVMTHLYRPLGGPPVPERMSAALYFPWCLSQVMAHGVFEIQSTEQVPQEAALDLANWRHYGIKSVLNIRLASGGKPPFGLITFCDTRAERDWPKPLIKRLELVAQMFANVLARSHAEQALRESEMRLSLAIAAAGAGPWVLDATGKQFWISPQLIELFGLSPQDKIDVECFIGLVHSSDRQLVRDALAHAVTSTEMSMVEYRIVRPDGQVCWVQSRGRLCARTPAESSRFMGITSDISERKLGEEFHRASEARIAAAIAIAGLGFYETGEDSRVIFQDERIRVMLGAPPGDETDGREFWAAHLDPEDAPRVLEASRKVRFEGLDRCGLEYRYRHPLQGLLWFHHLTEVLARNEDGRAVRAIGVIGDITERKRSEEALRQALDEVKQLRDRLQNENVYLRHQVLSGQGPIVGESDSVKRMIAMARKVAPADSAVLITGETGTGKELLAQAIHDLSSRRKKLMIKVNCAALPAPLIESELFGREKGAYTGAMTQQVGRFEIANGSVGCKIKCRRLWSSFIVKRLPLIRC